MATADEVLQTMSDADVYADTENEVFVIDAETRTINVPASESLFGVEGDKDVERKYFQCPKIVGDNIDLSQHQIYIAYVYSASSGATSFPNNADGLYHCEDVEVDGDNITFSWKLSLNVFSNPGFVAFKMTAKQNDGENLKTKWNTAPAYGTVLLTVPDGDDIAEQYPDVINQILDRLDELEESGGGGGTTNYNNLSNQPQINGVTLSGNKTSEDLNLQPAGTYLTEETDPTVPTWAKQATKPEYTADEVGALPENTEIPSKTSDLTNDSGFVTSSDVHNVPSGGTKGQVLSKKTNTNYDLEWKDIEGSGSIPRQEMQSADTTVTLQPNILYVFPEMASLTITLGTATDSSIVNEWHWFFDSGETACVFSLQNQDGSQVYTDAYSIDANMRYEVSVLNNVAYIKGVAITNGE